MRIFLILLPFLFISGCNSQQADLLIYRGTQRVTINITATNLTAETEIVVYMMSADNRNGFGRIVSLPVNISKEMPVGEYTFYGVSYNAKNLSTCALLTSTISEDNTNVVLDFQVPTCAHSNFIGQTAALNNGTAASPDFAQTIFDVCDTVDNIDSAGERCTDNMTDTNRVQPRGHITSLQYALLDYDKSEGVVSKTGTEINFGCLDGRPGLNEMTGESRSFLGNVIPAGDGVNTPFMTQLKFYSRDTTCSSAMTKSTLLEHGLITSQSDAKYVYNPSTSNLHRMYFSVSDADICAADTSGEFSGGFGTRESPKLICTVTDLYDIFPTYSNTPALYTSYANFHYKLLADLDLSSRPVKGGPGFAEPWGPCVNNGANFMPIGYTWDGTSCGTSLASSIVFDGGGHTISNMKIYSNTSAGLYHLFQNASVVQHLTLENIDVDSNGNAGAIASRTDYSTVQFVTLTNPIIDGNAGNNVGGITGLSLGGDFRNIIITNLFLRGASSVGGAVGINLQGISPPVYKNVFVDGAINASTIVGGIVGQTFGAGGLSLINLSRFTGSISATGTIIGGIAGATEYTRIESSYANTAFVSTAANNVYLGGLVGYAKLFVAGAGIYNSMVTGSITRACNLGNPCFIDTVVGEQDGSFVVGDFSSAIYPTSKTITGLSPSDLGTARPDTDFTTLPSPLAGPYPVSTWLFSTSFPKLQAEP